MKIAPSFYLLVLCLGGHLACDANKSQSEVLAGPIFPSGGNSTESTPSVPASGETTPPSTPSSPTAPAEVPPGSSSATVKFRTRFICSDDGTSQAATNLSLATGGVKAMIYKQDQYGSPLTKVYESSQSAVAVRNGMLNLRELRFSQSDMMGLPDSGSFSIILCNATENLDRCDISARYPLGQGFPQSIRALTGRIDRFGGGGGSLISGKYTKSDLVAGNLSVNVLYDRTHRNSSSLAGEEVPPGETPSGEEPGSGECEDEQSPLMVDVQGDGIELSAPTDGFLFDLFGNGQTRRISSSLSSDNAFLALPDAHGHITSIHQLFGNNTRGPDGLIALNGFEALKKWDRNGDRLIDFRDPVFSLLRLWSDINHNGHDDPGELSPLDKQGIHSIDLSYTNLNEEDIYGNKTKQRSTVSMRFGSAEIFRPIVDIWFRYLNQ